MYKSSGFAQIFTLVILSLVAITSFIIASRVGNQTQELRSRAADLYSFYSTDPSPVLPPLRISPSISTSNTCTSSNSSNVCHYGNCSSGYSSTPGNCVDVNLVCCKPNPSPTQINCIDPKYPNNFCATANYCPDGFTQLTGYHCNNNGACCRSNTGLSSSSITSLMIGNLNGTRCQLNADCLSGSCVPTPYGNYCGTSDVKCTIGQKQCQLEGDVNYSYSCNLNGFFEQKERCDAGCVYGICLTGVCVPNETKCNDPTSMAVCSAKGTAWANQSCGTDSYCYNKKCIKVSRTCMTQDNHNSCNPTDGFCQTALGYLYSCVGGKWQQMYTDKTFDFVDCKDTDVNLYIIGLQKAKKLIENLDNVRIYCKDFLPNNIGGIDVGRTYDNRVYWLNSIDMNNLERMCKWNKEIDTDEEKLWLEICKADGYWSQVIISATAHELTHLWVLKTGFNISSFNSTNGCSHTFSGYVFHKEPAVTSYGATNCDEALAVAVEQYLEDPCILKKDFPNQYLWMVSSPDSPFQGENVCGKGL